MARLIQVTRTVTQTYYVRVTDADTTAAAVRKARAVADEFGDANDPYTRIGPWRASVCETDDAPTVHITVSASKETE